MSKTGIQAVMLVISCVLLLEKAPALEPFLVPPIPDKTVLVPVPDKAVIVLPTQAIVVIPVSPDKAIIVAPTRKKALIPPMLARPKQAMIVVMPPDQKAVVTFYWPGEKGGRFSSDGKRLRNGDAAVDFEKIPKGSLLTLTGTNGTLQVIAVDRGGRDVINRKAAQPYGDSVIVIDVWSESNAKALQAAQDLGIGETVDVRYRKK